MNSCWNSVRCRHQGSARSHIAKSVTGTIQTHGPRTSTHHALLYRYLMNVAQGCSPPRTRRVKGGECPLPRLLPPPTPPHADLLLTPWTTAAALPISFVSQPTDLPPDRLSCFDLSVSSGFEEIWSEQIRTSWNC